MDKQAKNIGSCFTGRIFRKVLLLSFLLFSIFAFSASATYATTFYTSADATPSTLTNWWTGTDGTGVHPVNFATAGDIFIIQTGNNMTTTANWTVAGTVTINPGGTLTTAGTNTFSAGTLNINGTYQNGSTGTMTITSLAVGATGVYNHNTTAVALIKGSTTSTWDPASNMNINGLTGATLLTNFIGQTFGNVTYNCTGQTNTVDLVQATGTATVAGNFIVSSTGSNTLYLRLSGAGNAFSATINILGDFTLSGSSKIDMNNGGGTATTTVINLAGNFVMSGTSTLLESTTTANTLSQFNFTKAGTQTFTKAAGATITSGTTIADGIKFTVNSGSILDMGTDVLTGTNGTAFTLSSGAGIITANPTGLASSGATGSIQVAGTRIYNTSANYTYNAGGAQVTGNGLPTTVNNLTVAGGGRTMTFGAGTTETINGLLTLTGTAGNLLSLRSSSTPTQWNINPLGGRAVDYVDVQDSNNISAIMINPAHYIDSGNNINWFTTSSVYPPSAGAYSGITTTAITANWSANGNPAGTEYYCENTTAGTNSGWITAFQWTSASLAANTIYDFRVKARVAGTIESGWTALGQQVTVSYSTLEGSIAGIDLQSGDVIPAQPIITVSLDSSTEVLTGINSVYVDGVAVGFQGVTTSGLHALAISSLTIQLTTPLSAGVHSLSIIAQGSLGTLYSLNRTGLIVNSSGGGGTTTSGPTLLYPNPYDPLAGSLQITYYLSNNTGVNIYVFDTSGRLVGKWNYASGSNGGKAGYNNVSWNTVGMYGSLTSDVYIVNIVNQSTGKLIDRTKLLIWKGGVK